MRWISILLLLAGLPLAAQDMKACPMHKVHTKQASQHQSDVEKYGDQAMGFPHDKTTHHFRLYADGGAIEVTANDARDDGNIQAIQSHLKHIATMFSQGDFSVPMFIHDQVPPGVSLMKEKRAQISYSFEEVAGGGKLQIRTTDPDSIQAIHEFLRFQITEHHTGDPHDVASR
jgi:hypothetical protein